MLVKLFEESGLTNIGLRTPKPIVLLFVFSDRQFELPCVRDVFVTEGFVSLFGKLIGLYIGNNGFILKDVFVVTFVYQA